MKKTITPHTTTIIPRKRRRTAVSAFLFWSSAVSLAQGQCDLLADSCHYQFDGECDAGEYCSDNTDCFDCDACSEHNYDCGGCVAAGCFWCPGDALCSSQAIGADVWALNPTRQPACKKLEEWVQQCEADPDAVWTDPLYDSMKWLYQLIRVEEVWKQGLTGQGIHVRVNDDGVDADHPEFASNFLKEYSCEKYLPDNNETDKHGTACASLIAGNKNNDVCAAGVAPDVSLSACNGPETLDQATALFETHLEVVDVISNSWGPLPCEEIAVVERRLQSQQCPFDLNHPESPCNTCGTDNFAQALTPDCEQAIIGYCKTLYENDPVACGEYLDLYVTCSFNTISATNEQGFANVIAQGRGGKGPIITFAGGNDYKIGVDANYDGMVNSRYTIAVGAVGKDGLHASYSTIGAAIFVAAPGGDEESLSNNIVANPGGGCHDITVGTSFATPVVSAVAALILQANPDLGWRDVQGIMAVTSQRVDFEDESWFTNSVGISHSYKYGFGLIDALAAVELAREWQNWDSEKQIMVDSGTIDIAIPDDQSAVLATLTITESDILAVAPSTSMAVESVVVYLDLASGSRGDLEIVLISPQGTRSILAPGERPENSILDEDERWKLMTLRSWGEHPMGTWALEIADKKTGLISDCVNLNWKAQVSGEYWECNDLTIYGITDCSSPSQVPFSLQIEEYNGKTMFDACCACGGGTDATAIQQRLKSWKLIAYGHTAVGTIPPIPVPNAATLAPTTAIPSEANSTTDGTVPPLSTVAPVSTTQEPVAISNATMTPVPVPNATVAPVPVPTAPPVAACTYQNDTQLTGASGPLNAGIPDAGLGYIFSTMAVTDPTNSIVDAVEIVVSLTHQSPGDLKVAINTGEGTEIILAPGGRVSSSDPPGNVLWKFTTCEAAGEKPNGNWTLSVEDRSPGIESGANATVDLSGIVNALVSWNFVLYARSQNFVVPAPAPGGNGTVPGVPGVPFPPGGAQVPTPSPTLASPFTAALIMTIPPNTTNKPFMTNGDFDPNEFYDIGAGNSTSSSFRTANWSMLSLGVGLGMPLLLITTAFSLL